MYSEKMAKYQLDYASINVWCSWCDTYKCACEEE
jgi:hypothetical protein